jgi:hypothetical protein
MNRDAMIEALAKAIQLHPLPAQGGVHMGGGQARSVAAAVLDLCGTEPLAWREPSERDLKPGLCCSGAERIADIDKHRWYRVYPCSDSEWMWCHQFNGVYIAGSFHEACNDRPSAQAAAQSHATAAHWANTPLGKLVGVV